MSIAASVAAATTAANEAAGTVYAPLNFIRRQDTKPAFESSALTGGAPRYFYDMEANTVPIADMRPFADDLSLDEEGFELLTEPTAVRDFYDDDAVGHYYHDEIETLLRSRLGANRVVVFDVTRRSDGGGGAANPDGKRGPAGQLHVDYTEKSGPQRARDVLGNDEYDRLVASGARIVQVNVWRPIKGPVQRSPLALADAASIRDGDLIATDQIFPDRIGEIYNIGHSPTQRWNYAPQMTPDEVLLIKGWDSLDDGRARFTPHGAFNPPDVADDAPARESIEVRTIVIIE